MKAIQQNIENLKIQVDAFNNAVSEYKHYFKQKDKKIYKQLRKEARLNIQSTSDLTQLIGNQDYYLNYQQQDEDQFFIELLSISLEADIKSCIVLSEKSLKLKELVLQDKQFEKFLIDAATTYIFGGILGLNILSILFAYTFKDKTITLHRIRNFLSWYIVKSKSKIILLDPDTLLQKQQNILEQITTGIKYEKEQNFLPLNTLYYRKKQKSFRVEDITNNFIKIKYTSGLKHKHRFHKKPSEHVRSGHYRTYKNGNRVWIPESIINQNVA